VLLFVDFFGVVDVLSNICRTPWLRCWVWRSRPNAGGRWPALVAALAAIPAGPRLAAALAELDLPSLTGFDAVLVVKARNRQGNHERGHLLVGVAEVMRRKDPDYGAHDMERWDEVGANEIRAVNRPGFRGGSVIPAG
jgi:hypothetical protein